MALSSVGRTHTPGSTPDQFVAQHGALQEQTSTQTVLMSVRVSVCHSGIRPLCLPGAGGDSLRLQLSMDPGKSGEFRLSLLDSGGTGRSATITEFDLGLVNYEVKSAKCHELSLAAPPHDRISFNFSCEQEAQEWATVLISSLREAHRAALRDSDEQQPIDGDGNTSALQRTEETCIDLSKAIEAGDMQSASVFAATLARQHATLRIQPSARDNKDGEIRLAIVVEDSWSSCCVTVKVFPHMTTAALKQQMFIEYGFHPRVQRWVIGQCLCTDERSLASYGVHRDGDTAFLHLLSACRARLSLQVLQQDQENSLLGPSSLSLPAPALPVTTANGLASLNRRPYTTLPPKPHTSSNTGASERGNARDLRDLISLEMPQLKEALSAISVSTKGWSCPSCTYINKPTRPGCEICSTNRPATYVVPGGYRPDALELHRIQQEKESIKQYQQEKGRREVLRNVGAKNNSILFNLDQDY